MKTRKSVLDLIRGIWKFMFGFTIYVYDTSRDLSRNQEIIIEMTYQLVFSRL